MKALVIAGTTSGVGKTTVATGLMATLVWRGLKVQPFKAGPDYIDPTYHSWVTGVPSRNLDTWLLPAEAVAELFVRAMIGKDIAVVEGVMGLYDGRSALGEEGSTAELAKLLGAPVVLVVDATRAARSLAAMVKGYMSFDPGLHLGGVILNGIGSDRHLSLCRQAIEGNTGLPVLGYLPRESSLALPERHLGLIPTVERPAADDFLGRLLTQCQATLDVSRLLALSEQVVPPVAQPALFSAQPISPVTRIAVAQDKAFSFYYQDSLDLLVAWGAELVPFSPLEDAALPPGVDGIYIGGGFPQLYAEPLATNQPMKQAIKAAAYGGMPVYAECGGLMYLGRAIRDFQGREHPMVGAIPVSTRIDSHRLSLGYRTLRALHNGPLLRRGQTVRGHEFHWSVLENGAEVRNAYQIVEQEQGYEGFQRQRLLASYVHVHLGSLPSMSTRFVDNCRKFREKRLGQ